LYRDHRLEGTVRAYSGHTVTDDPYGLVGLQDLTAHVDFTRVTDVATRNGLTVAGLATQADFLTGNGLGELLVDLQRQPDLAVEEYYRAQAATFRLIDPGGMGRFRVLGLARNAPVSPPLAGFAGPDLPAGLRL
jgi:SAM-dependent MidA family methyltransferase